METEREGNLLSVPFTILFVFAVYKVPAFTSLTYFMYFLQLSAFVEAVIGDKSFTVDSSISSEVLKVGTKVH